jgi:uncharacterized SAM-binding protein YcdF (DUF218 family)
VWCELMPKRRALLWTVRRGSELTVVCALVAFTLYVSRSFWLPYIGGFLIVADPPRSVDGLVALAGDPERVFYGAALFNRGYAHDFIITDMRINTPHSQGEYARWVSMRATQLGVPPDRQFVAPGTVATTYEEANSVRQLAIERGWHSLMVVTSPFHTRRSRIIFQDMFRSTGITVIIRPVDGSWYKADSWWFSRAGVRNTRLEYLKLALYLVGYR